MTHENDAVNKNTNVISCELADAFARSLLAWALQLRNDWSAGATKASPSEELEALFGKMELHLGLPDRSASVLHRLQTLLEPLELADLESTSKRNARNAIHGSISSLCQTMQFQEAVENANRRSIYEFAYGLTHEINNPLANIVARAQQLIAGAASESDQRSLATIVDQAMRAHEMLAEMMRVVQPRPHRCRCEDIVSIVRAAAEAQRSEWPHAKIHFEFKLSATPLYCSADCASLTEAIRSILQNAMQACGPNDCIEIACAEIQNSDAAFRFLEPASSSNRASRENVLEPTVWKPSSQIRLAIRDTGPGMSLAANARAFDLYFSGREHGRGLGISLANVRRTVDAHGGSIWIDSCPKEGCTFEIRLPKLPNLPKARRNTRV